MKITLPRFSKTATGAVGIALVVAITALALIGPYLSPHPMAETIGVPGAKPGAGAILGLDNVGRDVFSRLLSGGRTVILLALTTTLLAYIAAVLIAALSGYRKGWVDTVLMRAMEILLAFPGLVLVLVLLGAAGNSIPTLIVGVVLMKMPTIVLILRAAVLEVSGRSYVEAAVARGESTGSVVIREIIPSISPLILADFGIRFGYSIATIASINFLGLGLAPPTADWGLMVAENRNFMTLNEWAVLAPATMLALLTIGVCLIGDAYGRSLTVAARPSLRRSAKRLIVVGAGTAGMTSSGVSQ
jgi:peptide/nickel transport system permease protein